MWLRVSFKEKIRFCFTQSRWRKESDPEWDPELDKDPDPLVKGTGNAYPDPDPHLVSRIPNTGGKLHIPRANYISSSLHVQDIKVVCVGGCLEVAFRGVCG